MVAVDTGDSVAGRGGAGIGAGGVSVKDGGVEEGVQEVRKTNRKRKEEKRTICPNPYDLWLFFTLLFILTFLTKPK